MQQVIIAQTIEYVKNQLSGAEGGHDWFHIERVWKTTKSIAAEEGVDSFVAELAALLHDIADPKFHNNDESIGPATAKNFLQSMQVDADVTNQVVAIIENVSFKGGHKSSSFSSPELDVVQDADRLDAIGAIGIARAFNYGGFKNRKMYDPAIPPKLDMTKEEYRASTAPTINHFYEKLLLLKDGMKTKTGKRLAADRHQFMETFLHQFYCEWEGER